MPTRLRLFFTFLLLFSTTASWADAPIKEIEGLKLKISSSNLGGVQKPLMIRSKDEAAIYFDVKSSAALKNEVNFSKQKVLVFVWRGSGQDRLPYVVLESFPEQIRFSYQRGRTRDLRQHFKVFVVRSNVKCSINGQPVEDKTGNALEIKENGKWRPANLPLDSLVNGKAIEVRVRGTLAHGIIAIGGETTGTTIRFGKTTWELDLRKEKLFGSTAERLNGKRVVVTGAVRLQKGVEIAKRTILTVTSIDSASSKDEVLK